MRLLLALAIACAACPAPAPKTIVTRSETLATHADCPGEAARFQAGLDADSDGALGDGEVSSTVVVCANADACTTSDTGTEIRITCPNHPVVVVPKSAAPRTLVVVKEATGSTPCPRGGHLVQSGVDDGPGAGEAGDGTLEPSEVDSTTTLCASFCGDSHTDANLLEQCDDGNTTAGDGCSPTCQREPKCVPPTPDPGCPAMAYHVDSIAPGSGPTTGISVTLTGDFPSNTAAANTVVTLAPGGAATVTAATPAGITFTMPPGAGTVAITLTIATAPIPFWQSAFDPDGRVQTAMTATGAFTFRAPAIASVAGCTNGGSSTTGCPVAGGTTLTVTGTDFGPAAGGVTVTVGGATCTGVAMTTPHTTLTCTLPAATSGVDVPVVVTAAGQPSAPAALVSYAVPAITPGTLRLVTGAPIDPLVLPSNAPQDLTFAATGLPASTAGVTVRYGTGAITFTCGSVSFPSAGNVQCRTAAGAGKDLRLSVCVNGLCSRPSTDRLSYPVPQLQGNTLRVAPGAPGTSMLITSGSIGDYVYFDVMNITVDPSLLKVTYGPYACGTVAVSGAGPMFTVECVTGYSAGGPHHFVVQTLNQSSAPGADSIFFPVAPVVTSVSGCGVSAGGATTGCPTEGGVRLTLTGTTFVMPSTVTVGGALCAGLVVVSSTRIDCDLPPGVGTADVQVHYGQILSAPVPFVGYARPSVARVSGCNDFGNTTEGCPAAGGVNLGIEGSNFGASGAIVMVGGSPCTQVAHDVAQPHRRLTCLLPAGTGRNAPLYVINGQISATPFYVHYQ